MIIDAHQHFWKLSRGDYEWLTPDLNGLYRDFLPEDLEPHLKNHGIERTIVVQAAPTLTETNYLLDLYEHHDFIAGVVGWLDLESEDFSNQFNHYVKKKGFVGIRPMLQDINDDRWILRPKVMRNIGLLVEEDFPIDLLVYPRHLPHILSLLKEFPSLRAVIDHIAKPDMERGMTASWKNDIEEIARYQNVYCKLSGLITEAGPSYKAENIKPFVDQVMNVFGKDSIMFGSDWPVCHLAGSYSEVWKLLHGLLPDNLSSNLHQKIFGENAARFYKLQLKE